MRDGSFTLEAGSNVTFTDMGGIGGNYNTVYNKTLTIYPSTAGKKVSVTLTSIVMEPVYDNLEFYNGDSTDTPLIVSLVTGDASEENPKVITSTADDGSLTIYLANDHGSDAGWVGSISEN